MWGNIGNFSDLAKAAEELQKQAASQITAPAAPFGGGFFNMDSLLQQEEQKRPPPKTNQGALTSTEPTASTIIPKAGSTIKPLASVTRVALPTPVLVPSIKGQLKIPQAIKATNKNTAATAAAAATTPVTEIAPPTIVDEEITSAGVEEEPEILSPSSPASSHLSTSEGGAFEKVVINHRTNPENGEQAPTISITIDNHVEEGLVPQEPLVESHHDESAADDHTRSDPSTATTGEHKDATPTVPLENVTASDAVILPNARNDEGLIPSVANNNIDSELEPTTKPAESSTSPTPSDDRHDEQSREVVLSEPAAPPVSLMAFRDDVVVPTVAVDTAASTTIATAISSRTTTPNSAGDEFLREQFSSQLSRLEENHSLEQQQLQQRYEEQLQELRVQLSQDQMEHERQLESWRLQRDSLKHELEGTQELLTAKKNDERKLQNSHLKELRSMEKLMNESEGAKEALKHELKEREKLLEQTREELQGSRDEYATLKERVMVVAGELKDRRAECRTLQSEVALLKDTNDAMHDQIMQLEAHGMDLNKSSTETYNELNGLKGQLMDKEKELQAAKNAIALEAQKGEEALSAYKRKAQQSLSLANSRTASAVQAKEDAEMEARAARSSADSAMERAMTAERKGIDALAEAKAYVSEMKEQVAKLDEIKKELMSTKAELERIQSETSVAKETVEKQSCELQSVHGRLEAEQMTTRELKNELSQANDRSAELLEEMERLRREGKRLKEDLQRKSEESTSTNSNVTVGATEMVPTKRSAEAEATIAMLQQELDDANQAIRELKETLKTTVEYESRGTETAPSNGGSRDSTSGMPLFYAMEKQAELTQARNEIARLAALVGNSEASKQEAIDDMDEMRRQLEELQSKLQRESRHSTPQEERVNLEYLKHVILSFLNAKSHLEKKTLLPVIGAVLCLTPQEQQQTLQHLDQEGKISLESVTSSVLNLKWS